MKNRSKLTIFTAVLSALASFALLPQMQATPQVAPAPDGCYPGFTTAEGCNALALLTTGAGNTGLGWYSLYVVGARSYNTGVGAGTLVLNNANDNTAVGAAALLLNTFGSDNTAVGTDALAFNTVAVNSNAVGAFALFNNDSDAAGFGSFNNAFGTNALSSNIDGIANSAFGHTALLNSTGFHNTALGASAGLDISVGNNINVIGYNQSGIDGTLGEVDNSTYISNIFDQEVPGAGAFMVFIDSSGKLGTTLVDANGNKVSIPASQASKPQAMLNRKVEELQATVAQLTQQLKEQAAQIQKVSAQLEMSKPAAKVVVNKLKLQSVAPEMTTQ